MIDALSPVLETFETDVIAAKLILSKIFAEFPPDRDVQMRMQEIQANVSGEIGELQRSISGVVHGWESYHMTRVHFKAAKMQVSILFID